jgi:hypothetical protein
MWLVHDRKKFVVDSPWIHQVKSSTEASVWRCGSGRRGHALACRAPGQVIGRCLHTHAHSLAVAGARSRRRPGRARVSNKEPSAVRPSLPEATRKRRSARSTTSRPKSTGTCPAAGPPAVGPCHSVLVGSVPRVPLHYQCQCPSLRARGRAGGRGRPVGFESVPDPSPARAPRGQLTPGGCRQCH